jgi:CheY-like chemotaxis protein
MTLRRRGYEVFEARDGKDALELLANCSSLPTLVLLNLTMPVIGALSTARFLATRGRRHTASLWRCSKWLIAVALV